MKTCFKFGDHVRFKDAENPVFGVVLEEANTRDEVTVQFISEEKTELVYSDDLELVIHPARAAPAAAGSPEKGVDGRGNSQKQKAFGRNVRHAGRQDD